MPDADLAIFVAEQLLAFRKRVTQDNEQWFVEPENRAAYESFAAALPHVWLAAKVQLVARPLAGSLRPIQ